MEVRTDSNMWYRIHPGTGKINILAFLDLLEWPAIIFSRKSHNLDYGGQEIKSLGDMKIITAETAFVVRTFFFIIFGWSVYLGSLFNLTVVGLGFLIVGVIFSMLIEMLQLPINDNLTIPISTSFGWIWLTS